MFSQNTEHKGGMQGGSRLSLLLASRGEVTETRVDEKCSARYMETHAI